jgi:Pectinacetylesterase
MKTFVLLAVLFTTHAIAKWESIKVPGAVCGDGLPYHVFLKKGSTTRLSIELQGGGACWDQTSCWGPELRNWPHPQIRAGYSYLSSSESVVSSYTQVFFPYCNGDVWMGDHDVVYERNPLRLRTFHWGKRNLEKGLRLLVSNDFIRFSTVESFLLFGSSAGAIGSLQHADLLDQYIPRTAKKLLIADSPGMHYGTGFWDKFSYQMLGDFKNSFDRAGMTFDRQITLIAPQMKEYCNERPDWKIGFIQATRDIVMSKIFGNISQDDHAKLVTGPSGIAATVRGLPNCSAHIAYNMGHAFLAVKGEMDRPMKNYVNKLIEQSL